MAEISQDAFNTIIDEFTAAQRFAFQALFKNIKLMSGESGKLTDNIRKAGNSFDYFSNSVDGSNRHMMVFNSVLRKGTSAQEEQIKNVSGSVRSLAHSFASSLNTFGQESSESSVHIKNAADIAAKAFGVIGDTISLIPLPGFFSFGKRLKDTAKDAADGLKFLATQVEGIRNAQRQFYESGVQFATGIDGAYKLVKDSNFLTLNDLAITASQAKDNLRLMSGGTASAMEKIVAAVNNMDTGTKKYGKTQLALAYSLGYSNQEIMDAMVEIASAREKMGDVPAMTSQELADATLPYLQNMRELERLTGIDAKARKANLANLRAELGFQNVLLKYAPEVRPALSSFVASLPPAIAGIAKFTMGGQALTADLQLLANQFPQLIPAIEEITKSGVQDPKVMLEMLSAKMGPDFDKRLEQVISGPIGSIALYSNSLSGSLSGLVKDLGQTVDWFQGLNKQLKDGGVIDIEKLKGSAQEAVESYVRTSAKLANTMNDLAFRLTMFANPALVAFSDGLDTIVDKMKGQFGKKEERDLGPPITKGEITSRPSRSGPSHFKYVPKNQDEFDKEIANLNEKGTELNDRRARLQARFIALDQMYNLLQEVGSLDVKGMEPRIGTKTLGTFEKARAENIAKLLTENSNFYKKYVAPLMSIDNDQIRLAPGGGQVPGQALGDIFNPKPGGHVIRVAEAFQSEIVAPAKRDPVTGQMGLVVSGAMLDNSTLLKDLATTNKNSLEMLANLNNRMFDLGRNMERLVDAQRESNRLAI